MSSLLRAATLTLPRRFMKPRRRAPPCRDPRPPPSWLETSRAPQSEPGQSGVYRVCEIMCSFFWRAFSMQHERVLASFFNSDSVLTLFAK